jgi:hypothetical protein
MRRQIGIDIAGGNEYSAIYEQNEIGGNLTDRIDLVAAPDPKAGPTEEEEGNVSADSAAKGDQFAQLKVEIPELTQCEEGHGGITASTPKSGGGRNPLGDLDPNATLDPCVFKQQPCCPVNEVPFIKWNFRMITPDTNSRIDRCKGERIGQIDCLEQRPQLVITIRALSENLERPVDLGTG